MRFHKHSGYPGATPPVLQRVLMITRWLLALLVAIYLSIHYAETGGVADAKEVMGLTLLVALLVGWLPVRSFAGRSASAITSDTVAEWLPSAMQGSGYGVTISDAQRRLVWVNESFTKMTGYGLDEAVGKKTSALLYCEGTDANTVQYVRDAFSAVRGIRFEILVHSKDGREWWLDTDAQPLLDERGTLKGWACIQTDVTDEVRKREAMRRDQHTS